MTRQVPPSWVWARFGDVAEVEANLVDPTTDKHAPHIAPNHIESRTGRLLPYSTVEADGVTSPKHAFTPNQILYSKIRPYLAKAVLVDFAGLCSADMYPIRSRIEPRYLHRWLISDEFTQQASWNQGRTVLPKINRSALDELPVPVPPENEQRRIVAKLDALMAKSRRAKEALDAIPPLLDKLRQSILAAAFRGDLTADWRAAHPDVEPASQLLQRIRAERRRRWEEAELAKLRAKGKTPTDDRWKAKYQEPEPVDESGLPELPEGWCWASVEELAFDVTVGHVGPMQKEYVESGVPFLRSQNVRANRFSQDGLMYISPQFHRELPKSRLGPGDVVIVRSGAPGTSCVIPEDLPDANCADLLIVRPISGIDPHFLALYFNASTGAGRVRQFQVGMAQQHFNVAAVRTFPIPIPPAQEGHTIASTVQASFRRIETTLTLTRELASSRTNLDSAILAKAFRGELVPQDPNDEPASVLLERIRSESGVQTKTRGRRARSKTA